MRLVMFSWLCILLFFVFSPPAFAASNGRIFGQLLDGSNHNTPVAGQSVTLQVAQGNTAKDQAMVKTDAHGSFSFANLATDASTGYALYTRYQGAQYTTNLVHLDKKPVQQVNLPVYEATTSTAKVAVVQVTILLQKPDASKNSLTVSELYVFRNLDTRTYVGSLSTSGGSSKPNALLFPLPAGTRNVSLGQGFDGYNTLAVNTGFATDAALPPGASEFSFSFQVPYTGTNYDFRYDVIYPTVQLSLMVPTEIHATSTVLASQGVQIANQHPYLVLQGQELLAGKEVQAQLEGLPYTKPATPNANSINPATLWFVVGLLVMLAILGVTWFLYRSRHQAPAKRGTASSGKTSAAATSKKSAKTPKPAASNGIKASGDSAQEQQEALLRELLELDKRYESGKLSKALYQEKRAKAKAQLRALMSEQEAL